MRAEASTSLPPAPASHAVAPHVAFALPLAHGASEKAEARPYGRYSVPAEGSSVRRGAAAGGGDSAATWPQGVPGGIWEGGHWCA